jgi:hypothetical protein
LKIAASPKPGTLKPPGPPETFDQLAGLLQLDGIADTQKRLAAEALKEWNRNNAEMNRVITGFIYWKF